jgi:hypothetical protein
MDGALERVLRLVAEGRLTAEEAGPILDALGAARDLGDTAHKLRDTARQLHEANGGESAAPAGGTSSPRFARIEVRDSGKRVVDLRIPISLGRFALGRIPGLSAQNISDVEQAVASGSHGPILDIEDADGDGVRIVLE